MAWSLMTFMMGFVGDWKICGVVIPAFFVVMFFRSVATGIGESFYGPCYPPLIAAYHTRTRSIALSIHQGSLYFGLMTCGAITAWVLGFLDSWRHVFMLFGVAGFILGVLFVFVLKDGDSEPAVSVRKDVSGEKESLLAGVRYFFRTPTAICAMAGFVAIVFANNAYLFWAPKYMATKFGTSVPEAGTQTMLWHHLFAFAAILAGGVLTDRFVGKMPRFRIGFQSVAMLCGAPCLAAIALMPSAFSMIAMTAAYGVFRGFFEVNTHATLFDVIPARYRSTAVGIFTVFAFLFGGLSGVAMGALSEKYGIRGFEIGFGVMAGAYALAALLMMVSFFFTFRKNRVPE
jgi:MFS family permease